MYLLGNLYLMFIHDILYLKNEHNGTGVGTFKYGVNKKRI